jgi:hypothetical protein
MDDRYHPPIIARTHATMADAAPPHLSPRRPAHGRCRAARIPLPVPFLVAGLIGLLLASAAAAQAFEGTYSAVVPNGEIRLVWTEGVGGRFVGSLTGVGIALEVAGQRDEARRAVLGTATAADGVAAFTASLDGDALRFTLFDVDGRGRPIASSAIELVFLRVASAPAATVPPTAQGPTPSAALAPSVAAPVSTGVFSPGLVEAVHDAIETALALPADLVTLAIDAALEGGRLARIGFAMHGTLAGLPDGSFTYRPEPRDALVIRLGDGREWAITFRTEPRGSFDGDGSDFMDAPHVIDLHVRGNASAGTPDVTITSTPLAADGTQDLAIEGGFVVGDHTWRVSGRFARFQRSRFDGIADVLSTLEGRAALSSDTAGVSATTERSSRYRLVNVVENYDRSMATDIVVGTQTYRLEGRVFVAFREALPVDVDQWVAEGRLISGGRVMGSFGRSQDFTGLQVFLEVDGQRVPLYFFRF